MIGAAQTLPTRAQRTQRRANIQSARQPRARQTLRGPLHVVVGCLLAVIVADTWFLAGLALPTTVASGSMAPTRLGPHRQWQCTGCGEPFVCSRESLPPAEIPAVCPWCGGANELSRGVDRPGQRMLIDRSAFELRELRRWEVVVCRSPEESSELCLKRVVGLPGETVELRDGQMWIDGRLAVKSLGTSRAMATPVSRACDVERHWQAEDQGQWTVQPDSATHRGATRATNFAWLSYRRPTRWPDSSDTQQIIVDESPTDQNESRLLQPVHDLILACDVRVGETSSLALRLASHGDVFTLELQPDRGQGRLLRNGQVLSAVSLPGGTFQRVTRLELAVVDQRVQWALDGIVLASFDFEPTAGTTDAAPAALGAQGEVDVSRLELLRDVVYTQPPAMAQYRLGPDEYFVLSDNSPHGADSRQWAAYGGVSRDLLVGKAWWW